jgi:hypothetical protein
MMQPHRAPKFGTARDLAEHASGYSSNGESIYSRAAAHSEPRMRHQVPRTKGRLHTLSELIVETDFALRRLQCELRIESNPKRRERLLKNIQIKSDYLAELGYEQRRQDHGTERRRDDDRGN